MQIIAKPLVSVTVTMLFLWLSINVVIVLVFGVDSFNQVCI